MEETAIDDPSLKPGPSSFWISGEDVQKLINHQATAVQVAAFLTLARYTDQSGMFSSAGRKAVKKALGNCGDSVANRALSDLQQMGLVLSSDAWVKRKGAPPIPERPTERARIRWVFDVANAKSEKRIWMANNLIDGYGQFSAPLKRLKQCGDVAARLLLLLYKSNDMEGFGGVPPAQNVFTGYTMKRIVSDSGSFDLWHGNNPTQTVYEALSFPALGISAWSLKKKEKEREVEKDEHLRVFFNALKALLSGGFIYEVVMVVDGLAGRPDSQPIYELDARSVHGYKPKGEEGLSGRTARISGAWGHAVTDSSGRFRNCYAAIVPSGMQCHILGIFRLRFRVSNPKNYTVVPAWRRIGSDRAGAARWLEEIENELRRVQPELFPVANESGNTDDSPQAAPTV
jgi:hypothetical protein